MKKRTVQVTDANTMIRLVNHRNGTYFYLPKTDELDDILEEIKNLR